MPIWRRKTPVQILNNLYYIYIQQIYATNWSIILRVAYVENKPIRHILGRPCSG